MRGRVWRVLLAVGALLSAGAGWADWVQTGERRRSSYEMFRSLQVLGLDVLDPVRLVWWWVPVLAGAIVVAAAAGRRRTGGVLAAVVALVVGLAAAGVLASGLAAGAGPWLAVAGVGSLCGGIVTLVQDRS